MWDLAGDSQTVTTDGGEVGRLTGLSGRGPRRVSLALLAVTCALLLAGPAAAQEIPRLEGQVTDLTQARVLAANRSQIDAALNRLLNERAVQLFVLFVDTTGDRTVSDYAREVVRANSLGQDDGLFLVAVRDRTYWLETDSLSGVTATETAQIRSRSVEPRLRANDWGGAVIAAADGLGSAVSGAPLPAEREPASTGGGVNLLPLLGIGLLIVGGLWLFGALSTSRRTVQQRKQTAEERDRRTGELAREANKLLIETDDGLRDAEQELAFAEAQFSESDVAPYRDALALATTEMKAAFAIRQQLDDESPEDPETRERLLREIIQRATKSRALLDEQSARIGQLRDLERRAPEILSRLPSHLEALDARIPQAEATLAELTDYAESSWLSVKGNVAEARKRLEFARQQLQVGNAAASSDDKPTAARSARSAQQAVAEAERLLDAIETLASSVRQAERSLAKELAAARADVDLARAALPGGAQNGMRAQFANAEQALQGAEREARQAHPDFLGAVRLATQANALADEVLAHVRKAEEQRRREAQLLESTLRQAEVSYRRAADYIASRRVGIGRAARTRLIEAESHYEQARALVPDDPHAALAHAQRAYNLAEDAYAQAVDDFEDYESEGEILTPGRRRRRGGGFFPPIIIGGGWGGGGHGGGGFGGTPWGSSGGGGFGGGSSGGGRF
jgi:uncharacterized membrane protein YgcG